MSTVPRRQPARDHLQAPASRYLHGLQRADADDAGPLGELLARAVLDSLHRFVVPAVAGPTRIVPLQSLATDEFSVDALRVAAIRGRLRALKGADGQWRSSRDWVDQDAISRHQRQP